MSSIRLPGKVLAPICGWPMLALQIERIMLADLVDQVVVVTPADAVNAPIWEFIEHGNGQVKLVKGTPEMEARRNVMGEVLKAAHETDTDVIVEVTGDCPLIDPAIIDLCAGYFICGDWDFVGNVKPHTWPRGMDVRIFSTATLAKADEAVRGHERETYWREHVSPYIYECATGRFTSMNIEAPPEETCPDLNLSVDTQDDLRRARTIFESLRDGNRKFTVLDMLQHLAGLPGYESLLMPSAAKEAKWLQRV